MAAVEITEDRKRMLSSSSRKLISSFETSQDIVDILRKSASTTDWITLTPLVQESALGFLAVYQNPKFAAAYEGIQEILLVPALSRQ